MPRRKYEEMTLLEVMEKVAQAGLSDKKIDPENNDTWDSDDSLDLRIEKLLGLLRNPNRKNTNISTNENCANGIQYATGQIDATLCARVNAVNAFVTGEKFFYGKFSADAEI